MKKQTSKQRKEDRKTGVINQVRKETRRKEGSEDRRKEVRDSLLEVTLALWLSFHCWHSDSVQICRRGRSTHELQVNVGRVSSATQPPLTVSTCLHGATEDYSSIKKKGLFRVNFYTFDCNEPKHVTKAGRAERSRHRPTAKWTTKRNPAVSRTSGESIHKWSEDWKLICSQLFAPCGTLLDL